DQKVEPAKSEEVAKGERVADIVTAVVEQHGDDRDRNALAQFEADPDDYRDVLGKKLLRLAETSPAVAQQLQPLAHQAGVQGTGVQGTVNISGGQLYGAVVGVNLSEIKSEYIFGRDDDKDEKK